MEDYLLAIQYFNLAIKAKPYLADAYYFRGLAKLSLDDYDGAVADCTRALERNKFKSDAYKVRGFAYLNQHKDSLAVVDFKKGLEYNPTDKYFLYYKGIGELELDRLEAADSTLATLMRLNPKFEDGYVARARLRALEGDTVAARQDLDLALRQSKSLINAYLMKVDLAQKQKDWEEALQNMDEAIRLRPDDADFYVNRAYLRYNNEDFFGAMSDYNYALDLDPESRSARFNRALLRTEVKELAKADEDFTEVLRRDPHNFYALYNRALVNLEMGNYRKALEDFSETSRRFPRFHPAYYAMAECYRQLGNTSLMVENIKKADRLVESYVKNPTKNPLDRPTIAAGKTHSREDSEEETDEQFADRFNQLITHSDVGDTQLSYNDRIKGRVQDRNIQVQPAPAYTLSFFPPEASLRQGATGYRDLESLNHSGWLTNKVYVVTDQRTSSDKPSLQHILNIKERYSSAIEDAGENSRPIDYFARGLSSAMMRDYGSAIADLSIAVETTDDFTPALFARAFAYYSRAQYRSKEEAEPATALPGVHSGLGDMRNAMDDLDLILRIIPDFTYAWFNKGSIYYALADYTSAIQCYTEAINNDSEFGEAYFNRGLAYMMQGNRRQAFADLSKAGELGVLQSYNIIKRMK